MCAAESQTGLEICFQNDHQLGDFSSEGESNNLAISENPSLSRQLRGKALWASLATLIDGEGCIGILKGTRPSGLFAYSPDIRVVNTNRNWMAAWQNRTGRGYINSFSNKNTKWKDRHTWIIAKKADVIYILKKILPYLFVKREQAEIAIRAIEEKVSLPHGARAWNRPSEQELARREDLYQRMRTLNKKGRSESVETTRQTSIQEDDIVRSSEQPEAQHDNVVAE